MANPFEVFEAENNRMRGELMRQERATGIWRSVVIVVLGTSVIFCALIWMNWG